MSAQVSEPMKSPRVSIIVPTYNSEGYLEEALRSLVAQDFADLEVIIIDEADSTDSTEDIVSRLGDERIRYVRNETKLGLARSLNAGIALARGEFIARMDADDVAAPERIGRQVELLDRCLNVAVVGSAIQLIDGDGRQMGVRHYPVSPARTRWYAHFNAPVAHPSVMFRKSIVEQLGMYSDSFLHCEDYELWLHVLDKTDMANLSQPLLRYRIHGGSVSTSQCDAQANASLDLSCRSMAATLGRSVDREAVDGLKHPYSVASREQLSASARLLYELVDAYLVKVPLDKGEVVTVRRDVAMLTSHLFMRSLRLGPGAALSVFCNATRYWPSSLPRLIAEVLMRALEGGRGKDVGLIRA